MRDTYKFKDAHFPLGGVDYHLSGTYSPPTKPTATYPGDGASLEIDVAKYYAPEGFVTITELWNALDIYERYYDELYAWAFRTLRVEFYDPEG